MAKWLAIAAVVWPLFLSSGVWARVHDGPAWLTATVYLSASRVCHQRPERSFRTAGVAWPVCGRCAGLYLAAPIGAIVALRRRRSGVPAPAWLLAAAPTAATLALEYFDLVPMSSLARAWAAAPLGAAVAFAIVAVARRPQAIE